MSRRGAILFAGAAALILSGCEIVQPTPAEPVVRAAPAVQPVTPRRTQAPAPAVTFTAGGSDGDGGGGGGGDGGGDGDDGGGWGD